MSLVEILVAFVVIAIILIPFFVLASLARSERGEVDGMGAPMSGGGNSPPAKKKWRIWFFLFGGVATAAIFAVLFS